MNGMAETFTEKFKGNHDLGRGLRESIFMKTGIKNFILGHCTEIGNGALRYCSKLTSLKIPEGVTKIGDAAFGECYYLTSLRLPDSLE